MEINKENIDWVWVDLDDTIWDFKTNSWEALAHVYEYANLEKVFGNVDTWRTIYQDNNHQLWLLYNAGKITKEYLMMERFRKILVDVGYDNDLAEKMSLQLSDVYLDKLASLKTLVPGARQILDYLKCRGYSIGVISNGFYEVQHRKMVSAGIIDYFDAVVLSDDIGVNKPDRRIFDYALQKSETEACRTLIIGDNPDTDIVGAVNAGWHAIYFNRDGEGKSLDVDGVIEIINLFKIQELL